MDINNSLPYEKLQELYKKYFSLSYLGNDINNKFALISLVCYLTNKLKAKNPDITHWTVLYNINNKGISRVPEDILKGLAVICSDLGYACTNFPTFGLKDKEIPNKIKEILNNYLPF